MSEVVSDCIFCGLPYSWHDQNPANWLACPSRERLVEIERDLEEQPGEDDSAGRNGIAPHRSGS